MTRFGESNSKSRDSKSQKKSNKKGYASKRSTKANDGSSSAKTKVGSEYHLKLYQSLSSSENNLPGHWTDEQTTRIADFIAAYSPLNQNLLDGFAARMNIIRKIRNNLHGLYDQENYRFSRYIVTLTLHVPFTPNEDMSYFALCCTSTT